ncbi:hypothetical protein P171DRAFT_493409 [Karstenula rhodostoma CBS 690.94]|uniref:Uncharacterized protein n=1 Tax=Karstenula rhodostoma CBS 690.94 TaxID=1392251 RepID=A0A9P4PWN5_9PLEO|nr:hypothetical protein P171DRAFT_493409 [Karstenula rhodostoma CBS 690.94]
MGKQSSGVRDEAAMLRRRERGPVGLVARGGQRLSTFVPIWTRVCWNPSVGGAPCRLWERDCASGTSEHCVHGSRGHGPKRMFGALFECVAAGRRGGGFVGIDLVTSFDTAGPRRGHEKCQTGVEISHIREHVRRSRPVRIRSTHSQVSAARHVRAAGKMRQCLQNPKPRFPPVEQGCSRPPNHQREGRQSAQEAHANVTVPMRAKRIIFQATNGCFKNSSGVVPAVASLGAAGGRLRDARQPPGIVLGDDLELLERGRSNQQAATHNLKQRGTLYIG